MDKIITRPATFADMETLLRFEQGVITAERPFDPTLKDEPINYYDLAGMIERTDIELLVAELNGELIGSGYARIEEAKIYLKHPKHAYLGFMYVAPAYRGKGINQKIIVALKNWAAEKKVHELRLEVYYDNLPAIKAYEKIGFSKLMIKMRSAND
jgi:ribosomal protein S18 acetylase RimI-like enzyme